MRVKQDIKTRADLEWLVSHFYQQLITDEVVGFYFTEIVPIDLEEHLPVIVAFWESSLLRTANYRGNPMIKHIEMSRKHKLERKHLERWLSYWEETIHGKFEGPIADLALSRARSIGEMILYKTDALT